MSPDSLLPTPDGKALQAAFANALPGTIGIEDELMLVDPETLALAPVAENVLARCDPEEPIKAELPLSQLEIVTPVVSRISDLAEPLLTARTLVASRCDGLALPVAAGVHPFSTHGALNQGERYHHTLTEYGPLASRQLVCALQVHVAVGDADVALAVYNHARDFLPLLAALAANAPLYRDTDTGFASVRPLICQLLPRQGIPPVLTSWDELADALRWGAAAGAFAPRAWWWALRPHPRYGTLEFRVPDAQSTVADALAVAAVIQSLVAWLTARHEGGDAPVLSPTWRIEQNAWSAARYGTAGTSADLLSGAPRSTGDVIHELLDTLHPHGRALGCSIWLDHARGLLASGGAERQREVFAAGGAKAVVQWLSRRFREPVTG